jgi:hypothetical protein
MGPRRNFADVERVGNSAYWSGLTAHSASQATGGCRSKAGFLFGTEQPRFARRRQLPAKMEMHAVSNLMELLCAVRLVIIRSRGAISAIRGGVCPQWHREGASLRWSSRPLCRSMAPRRNHSLRTKTFPVVCRVHMV